jgi:hypothetical protein
MKKLISTTVMITVIATLAFGQTKNQTPGGPERNIAPYYRYSISSSYLTFTNFIPPSVDMYEFHFGYRITPKDIIAIKAATWSLFEPMGIPLGDPLFQQESEWYPGRIREYGVGIKYQRFLWKGLFSSIEILPLKKTYLDEDNEKIDDGFKLYTSYHLGYHVPLFKNRFYIEPQIHCNYWPIDTEGPQGFEEKESKWNNYFLFEPNLYIGVNF